VWKERFDLYNSRGKYSGLQTRYREYGFLLQELSDKIYREDTGGFQMKFVCKKCCDEMNSEPCRLDIPKDPDHTEKDIRLGLTTCPFEGMDYHKGKWVKNGSNFPAKWEKVK
jgi:hypothetical protein